MHHPVAIRCRPDHARRRAVHPELAIRAKRERLTPKFLLQFEEFVFQAMLKGGRASIQSDSKVVMRLKSPRAGRMISSSAQ